MFLSESVLSTTLTKLTTVSRSFRTKPSCQDVLLFLKHLAYQQFCIKKNSVLKKNVGKKSEQERYLTKSVWHIFSFLWRRKINFVKKSYSANLNFCQKKVIAKRRNPLKKLHHNTQQSTKSRFFD